MMRIKGAAGRWVALLGGVAVTIVLVAAGLAHAEPPRTTGRATTYFARVGDDGTSAALVAARGATSVEFRGVWEGYLVTFDRPVDECGWTVSVNPAIGGPLEGFGEIQVGLDYRNTDPDFVPDPTQLKVVITDGNHQAIRMDSQPWGGAQYPDTFTVAVHC